MRRVAALVLPNLACEIARYRAMASRAAEAAPIAVVLDRGDPSSPLPASAVIDAVEEQARRFGVRPGQRVSEALALLSSLEVCRVSVADVALELGRVAELALDLAPIVSIALSTNEIYSMSMVDNVWLDITGAAHLRGGEQALADELVLRAASLGHSARVAIASGPRIAAALARYGDEEQRASEDFMALPVRALPTNADTASWFARLGVLTVGDLAKLPRKEASARLGESAAEIALLIEGYDAAPLLPYSPPRIIVEELAFEEGVASGESLLFVLRAMTARVAARLAARGEACGRLEVTVPIDRSIARLRSRPEDDVTFAVDLPSPLAAANDLLRALKPEVDRLDLPAPAIAVRLAAPRVARAEKIQLDLARDRAASPDDLPALLAELSADIGKDNLGVLSLPDEHLPERRSRLVPCDLKAARALEPPLDLAIEDPSRLLAEPLRISSVAKGAVIAASGRLWSIDDVHFSMRLDDVAWWTKGAVSRDYARAWLRSDRVVASALVFVDRSSGEAFLQGWFE